MGCRPRNRVTDPRNFSSCARRNTLANPIDPTPSQRPASRSLVRRPLPAYLRYAEQEPNQERSSRTAGLSGPFLPGVPTRRTLNQSRESEFSQLVPREEVLPFNPGQKNKEPNLFRGSDGIRNSLGPWLVTIAPKPATGNIKKKRI